MMINYRDMVRNVMAREKVLYEGHAVAAVAATSAAIAKRGAEADQGRLRGAAARHRRGRGDAARRAAAARRHVHGRRRARRPTTPSNVAKRIEFALGDVAAGFARPTWSSSASSRPSPVHQGYIEPHACVASVSRGRPGRAVGARRRATSSCAPTAPGCSAGTSARSASPRPRSAAASAARPWSTSSRWRWRCPRRPGRPVKMVMTREEVFRATGPTSGAHVRVKIGATKDGRIVAAEAELKYQAGAFPGSPVQPGCHVRLRALRPRERQGRRATTSWSNRPKVAAYRAPGGADLRVRGRERDRRDRQEARHRPDRAPAARTPPRRAPRPPTGRSSGRSAWSRRWRPPRRTRTGARRSARTRAAASPPASGSTSAARRPCRSSLNEDGTLSLIGRHARHRRPARLAGDDGGRGAGHRRSTRSACSIGDTGRSATTSSPAAAASTFSSGMAIVEAAREVMKEACKRAAKLWELPEDAVEYEDGAVRPAGRQRRQARADDADGHRQASPARPAGRSPATRASTRTARRRASPRTSPTSRSIRRPGACTVLRYTAIQDAGRAIHPSYVEGQYPGRRGAGHRLGAERGVHLRRRRQAAERRLPRLSHAGGLRPADDRHGDRRGAEPAPSLRRARRRRDADRAADGGHRQRDRATPPASASPSCRCRRRRCSRRSGEGLNKLSANGKHLKGSNGRARQALRHRPWPG